MDLATAILVDRKVEVSQVELAQVFLVFVAVQGVGKFMLESFRFIEMPEIRYATLLLGLAAMGLLGIKAQEQQRGVSGAPLSPQARP